MNPFDLLDDHTYRMVLGGCTTIGVVCGALGAFAYLRKQSLVADLVAHAALPGTLLAFLAGALLLGGAGGDSIPALLVGAIVMGLLAAMLANWFHRSTKLSIDTTMAVVLTQFFALAMILLRVISNGPFPGKGGVQDYLFGNAAVITKADLAAIAVIGVVAIGLMIVFWKEFALRTFDVAFARSIGMPVRVIDYLMFGAIVLAVVVGAKAVGLVLMVAFVVSPPAAARQWTRRLGPMVALSAVIGGACAGLGAYLSIVIRPEGATSSLPTGPMIVLVLFAVVVISLLFAPGRSLIGQAIAHRRAKRELIADLRNEATASTSWAGERS